MVLPDFLIRLLEILHLKDSEETKLKKQIAQCDENIRSLNQGLEQQIKDILALETEFRELKVRYDAASGPVRETLAVRMKSILEQREHMTENRKMSQQQLKSEKIVKHNLGLQLEYIQHPDNHDLRELQEEKKDIIDDLKEQAKTLEELEKTTLPKDDEKDVDFDKALDNTEDEFKDVDLSFSAPAPEKKEEEKKKEEA
ncbi:MAG: hypothetical protein IKP58_10955 [Victivallales bacterium]|nr:hypothetical protein [Victivallales bacterium]